MACFRPSFGALSLPAAAGCWPWSCATGTDGKRPQSRKKERANILATDLIGFFSGKVRMNGQDRNIAGRPILDERREDMVLYGVPLPVCTKIYSRFKPIENIIPPPFVKNYIGKSGNRRG
jgi:hypothetical protein